MPPAKRPADPKPDNGDGAEAERKPAAAAKKGSMLEQLAREGAELGEHELPAPGQVRHVLAALVKRAEGA